MAQEVGKELIISRKKRENYITYMKHKESGDQISILSIPWSYLVTGLFMFIIGILDFKFLGYLIGHPGEEIIGEYIGQGIAVYLGGVSFAWTIGLAPLIVGAIMVVYCVYASKYVTVTKTDNSYIIQERRLLFPLVTEIEHSSIRKTNYTNKGLQLRHVWIMLFIPIGIRILQFGVPLFNEHLAHDNILPIMMVLTGCIDILGTLLMLFLPTHTLSFKTEGKMYSVNFQPIISKGNINRVLELENTTSYSADKKVIRYIFNLIAGTALVILSSVGISLEYLWGTDLAMVGMTYGIYLVLQVVQNETSLYFTSSRGTLDNTEKSPFRDLAFIDVVGIGLLVYLSTLEFVWGWVYISGNWLTILDMLLTTVFWFCTLFWIFLYLSVPLQNLKQIKRILKSNRPNLWKFCLRMSYIILLIVLALIVAF